MDAEGDLDEEDYQLDDEDYLDLLKTREAAPIARRSPRTLERLRCSGGGPPFVKLGRAVLYPRRGLAVWVKRRRRTSTSDPGPVGSRG